MGRHGDDGRFGRGAVFGAMGGLALASALTWAAPLGSVPHSFQGGTAISSTAMNENFGAVVTAVDAVDARVGVFTNPDTNATWTEINGICGYSTARTGNLGGYRGSKAVCETTCGTSGAHMCTMAEVTRSYASGTDIDFSNGDPWVDGPLPFLGLSSGLIRSCMGWTNQSAEAGWKVALIAYSTDNPGGPSISFNTDGCSTSHPVLCCD